MMAGSRECGVTLHRHADHVAKASKMDDGRGVEMSEMVPRQTLVKDRIRNTQERAGVFC